MKVALKAHTASTPSPHPISPYITHKSRLWWWIHVCLCSSNSLSRITPHAGAERHLQQAGQAFKDALRHARQLVIDQIKVPVGMQDMSTQIQPVALSESFWMAYIAQSTTCTRAILISPLLFIIVFIHFYLMQFSRYRWFEHFAGYVVHVPRFGAIM